MNPVQDLWSAQPLTPPDVQSDKEINSSGGPVPGEGASGRQSGHAAVGHPASGRRPGAVRDHRHRLLYVWADDERRH